MNDLRDAFRSLDALEVPDVPARARAIAPREPDQPAPAGARRLGVIVLATLVAAAGIGLVVVRFQHDTAPGPVTPTPKSNGVIYYRVGGGDGPSWWESVAQDGTGKAVVFPADAPINHDDVSWSADGARIAFTNTISSRQPGIYVSDPDGSPARRLTNQPEDLYPSWSPDGNTIAFVRPDPGADCSQGDSLSRVLLCPMSIFVVGSDGSGERQLLSNGHHLSQPVWSPDGTQIAFTGSLGTGDTRTAIFVMNADGSGVHQVSPAAGGSDFSPRWSPDGSKIAFASIRYEDWGISVVDADGADEHLLVSQPGAYVEDPVWSPDGTTIAFVGDPGLAGAHGVDPALLAIPSEGGPVRLIAQATGYGVADVAWQPLPVGTASTTAQASEGLMAFSVRTQRSTTGLVIAVMRPDGTAFRQLTGFPADRDPDPEIARYTFASDDSPSFSPDGRTIAFVRRYTESVNSLCMIDVDGSNFRVIERDAHMGEIAWSPDGRTIAFYSEQDGGIHLIDVDGTNERPLWPRTGGPNQDAPSWSPDSSQVFYVSGGVWLADAGGSGAREIIGILSAAGWVAASPDGSMLAVTESKDSIWVFDPDGTNGRHFTPAVDRNWFALTWSPDGSELVLVADDGSAFLTTRDGSRVEPVQLPDRIAVSGAIAWSGA